MIHHTALPIFFEVLLKGSAEVRKGKTIKEENKFWMLTIFKRSSGFNQDFQRWPVNLYFSLAIQQKALIFRKVLNHPEYLIYYCTPLENQATLCTNVKNLKILISFEFYIFFFPIKTSLFCHRQHNKHLIPTINTIIIKKKCVFCPEDPCLEGSIACRYSLSYDFYIGVGLGVLGFCWFVFFWDCIFKN